MSRKKDFEIRLWDKIKIGPECWEWQAGKSINGYGRILFKGKNSSAHRILFQLWHNIELEKHELVLHSCNNRGCVNPDHLRAGTSADNMQDCIDSRRHFYANKTHCINGHAFTKENTKIYTGKNKNKHRGCRKCTKINGKNRIDAMSANQRKEYLAKRKAQQKVLYKKYYSDPIKRRQMLDRNIEDYKKRKLKLCPN